MLHFTCAGYTRKFELVTRIKEVIAEEKCPRNNYDLSDTATQAKTTIAKALCIIHVVTNQKGISSLQCSNRISIPATLEVKRRINSHF